MSSKSAPYFIDITISSIGRGTGRAKHLVLDDHNFEFRFHRAVVVDELNLKHDGEHKPFQVRHSILIFGGQKAINKDGHLSKREREREEETSD